MSRNHRVHLGQRIHPELRKALKAAAALEGVSMERKLHEILCQALDRDDLFGEFFEQQRTVVA